MFPKGLLFLRKNKFMAFQYGQFLIWLERVFNCKDGHVNPLLWYSRDCLILNKNRIIEYGYDDGRQLIV